MKKTTLRISALSTILILIISILSCSKQDQSMDEKYLDKVQTLDSTINAFYAAISSDNGQAHDFDLYKYVMHPEAKLIAYEPSLTGVEDHKLIYYTADDYIKKYGAYMVDVGFYEKEIFRKVTTFGPISHVLSGYASYEKEIEKPIISGVNSFQLLNDGKRWWVINAYYTRETPKNPIPKEFFE